MKHESARQRQERYDAEDRGAPCDVETLAKMVGNRNKRAFQASNWRDDDAWPKATQDEAVAILRARHPRLDAWRVRRAVRLVIMSTHAPRPVTNQLAYLVGCVEADIPKPASRREYLCPPGVSTQTFYRRASRKDIHRHRREANLRRARARRKA